jgi:mRNA interferase MazF
MRRGEVYWADLAPRSGSEQSGAIQAKSASRFAGKRPVVLVSDDGFNQAEGWRSVIVVPITTSGAQERRGPTLFEIPAGVAGLSKQSVAICHQVTTLDRAKLTRRMGILTPVLLERLAEALKAAVDLN